MPTYMVGAIRRRLEQSWWSSGNSSGCTPCMDLKEIHSQRSLDSDYPWHHSSCSESDDTEDTYREYELQSPASITSYDDVDISSLTGEDLPASGSVAEENVYPSQNLFRLTWDQDESVFKGVQPVEAYLDTSMHIPHSNSTSNSNLQVSSLCCTKLFPPCKTCQAHVDAGTFFAFMEDMSWLQKTNSGTEVHKFDFGHSLDNTLPSRNLPSEIDPRLAVVANEENYEAITSSQGDSTTEILPDSYVNLDSVKEEFSEVPVVPPTSKSPLIFSKEHLDTIDSTCILLLDKVTKENGRDVLGYNCELSECSSSGLLGSVCENRQTEEHLKDTDGNVVWDNHDISGLNAGSDVNKNLLFGYPDSLSGNSVSIIQNIKNHYSTSSETVADDQSWSHVEAINVKPRHLENRMTCEAGNAEVSLVANWNSVKTVTVICEDIPETGGFLPFAELDRDRVVLEGLLGRVDDEGSSMCALNAASLNENKVNSMSGELCNLSVGTSDLDRDSAFCQESLASTTDRDPHTSHLQNQALLGNNFLGVCHIDAVSEKLGQSQVSVGCSESNTKYPLRNKQCSRCMDVIQGASDSSADHGKQSDGFPSCNGDALSAMEEQTFDLCAELHDQSWSSESLSRVNDYLAEEDLIFEKLLDEDGQSCCSALEDMKQIPANNFCMNKVESQSGENSLSKASASNEHVKVHQILVTDGKSCNQPVQNQTVNNLWMEDFRKQITGSEQSVTGGEGEILAIEPGKTCSLCCRKSDEHEETKRHSFVEPCTGNSVNRSIKDKVPQDIECKNICETPKGKYLTHNETILGSLYSEESSVSILHPLHVDPKESKGSQELCQGNIQKMEFDASVDTRFPMIDFSDRQVSVGTCHDYLDQAEACALKIGGLEIAMACNEDCLSTVFLDTNVVGINPEGDTHLSSSDSHTVAHSESISSTDYLELGGSYMQREESPCSTAISAAQHIEMNNRHQPFMVEGANIMYQNDFLCAETIKKDEDICELRTLVKPDERKGEEAAGLESKPGKKILLKSFAGGMTVLGALFILLHFRRRKGRGNVVTNVAKKEKASHEKRPDKDKNRLYPAEKFKF